MADFLTKNLAFLLGGDPKTQAQMAEKAGTTQPTISKWSRLHGEQSTSDPTFRSMARLAEGLNFSLDDLAFRDIEAKGPSGVRVSQPERLDPERMATAAGTIDSFLQRTGHKPSVLQRFRALCDLYIALGQQHPSQADASAAMAVILESLGKREP